MQDNTNKALLEQIGALYTRNKALTKGHATLTRRVQELEAKLAEAQQKVLNNSSGVFSVVSGKVHVNDAFIEKHTISKAHHDLQQFVTEEVKHQLVAATKLGGILNGR